MREHAVLTPRREGPHQFLVPGQSRSSHEDTIRRETGWIRDSTLNSSVSVVLAVPLDTFSPAHCRNLPIWSEAPWPVWGMSDQRKT